MMKNMERKEYSPIPDVSLFCCFSQSLFGHIKAVSRLKQANDETEFLFLGSQRIVAAADNSEHSEAAAMTSSFLFDILKFNDSCSSKIYCILLS